MMEETAEMKMPSVTPVQAVTYSPKQDSAKEEKIRAEAQKIEVENSIKQLELHEKQRKEAILMEDIKAARQRAHPYAYSAAKAAEMIAQRAASHANQAAGAIGERLGINKEKHRYITGVAHTAGAIARTVGKTAQTAAEGTFKASGLAATRGEEIARSRRQLSSLALENKIRQERNIARQQHLQAGQQRDIERRQRIAKFQEAGQVARSALGSGEQVQSIFTMPGEANPPYEPFSNFLAPQTEAFQYPNEWRGHTSDEDAYAFVGGAGVYRHPGGEREPYSVSNPNPQTTPRLIQQPTTPSVPPVKIEIAKEEPEKFIYKKKERIRHGHQRGRPRRRGRPTGGSLEKQKEKQAEKIKSR